MIESGASLVMSLIIQITCHLAGHSLLSEGPLCCTQIIILNLVPITSYQISGSITHPYLGGADRGAVAHTQGAQHIQHLGIAPVLLQEGDDDFDVLLLGLESGFFSDLKSWNWSSKKKKFQKNWKKTKVFFYVLSIEYKHEKILKRLFFLMYNVFSNDL